MDLQSKEPQRKVLGRGLAALIPPGEGGPRKGLQHIGIEKIKPSDLQPRKVFDPAALEELAASIKEHGVLQPVVVRKHGDHYELIAGERRWRACGQAGLHDVPAVVKDFSDEEALQSALIENIQRQDLDPLEEAYAYRRLIDEYALTQEEVAKSVGKSRVSITNTLRLLKLPESILAYLAQGKVSPGHARAIMMLESVSTQEKLADDIIRRGLSVRDAEVIARRMNQSAAKAGKKVEARSAAETEVENKLQEALGTKCRLHYRSGKGRIEIFFHQADQFEEIVRKIVS
ncbi:MAG: chromosome partitioning protein ParB [Myxococcales bacterium]|nr:chromosome partitioning protein ParB [Myxococcales bacterium]